MKAKGLSIYKGITRKWRDTIEDVENWINGRRTFLLDLNKFDTYDVTREGNTITINAHRDAKGRMKESDVTYILTIIEE